MILLVIRMGSSNLPMKKYFFIVVLILSGGYGFAQEVQKNSLSGNALGICALAGVSYERVFFDHLAAEIGVGLMGIGGGLTYYPIKAELGKIRPYSGIKSTFMALVDVGGGSIVYVPFGATYFSKWGFNFGLDLGPAFGSWRYMDRDRLNDPMNITTEPERIRIWGNVKIGIRF